MEKWHEINDGDKILVQLCFRPSILAVRAILPIRDKLEALGLVRHYERRQPTLFIGLPMLDAALEILPPAARELLAHHRSEWVGWRAVEQRRQRDRDRYGLRLAELAGHDGRPPLPIDVAPWLDTFHDLEIGSKPESEGDPRDAFWQLYGYQRFGVAWLRMAQGRAILGDDMGLGKTQQILAYLEELVGLGNNEVVPICRVLVVAPTSVCMNWSLEGKRWAPSLPLVPVPSRAKLAPTLAALDRGAAGIVISWGLLPTCIQQLLAVGFDTVVFDEAHNIKEPGSQRSQAAEAVALLAERRLLATGTAVPNRPREFYSLLRIVDPLRYPVFLPYGESYCGARNQRRHQGGTVRTYRGASRLSELNRVTRPLMLRRTKFQVLPQLPPKRYRKLVLPVPNQTFTRAYKEVIGRLLDPDDTDESVLGLLGKLRHQVALAKVDAALEWIEDARASDEALLVFFHYTDVHAALCEGLTQRGISFDSIVGSTPMKKRQQIVDCFQAGDFDVFLGSTAAKEGITLTRAAHTLHVEYWWVPGDMDQSDDRVHRIGQIRATLHTRLHLADTIDDYVAQILSRKRKNIDVIVDRGSIEREVLRVVLA
jgi:SNF2 family DNA or RNA helicase